MPVTPSVTATESTKRAEGQPVAPVSFATEQMARMILAQEQLSSDKFFNPRIGTRSRIARQLLSIESSQISRTHAFGQNGNPAARTL
jgi:hypothetical protein